MRNGKTLLDTLTLGHNLKAYIVMGLCCYFMLLSATALTHDHSDHVYSKDTCAACFYNSQHVGVEIEPTAFISPSLCSTNVSSIKNRVSYKENASGIMR